MAIFTAQSWNNDAMPEINAASLQAITDCMEPSQTITGAGAPTTSTAGVVGCMYFDTTGQKRYQCTAASGGVYTWAAM